MHRFFWDFFFAQKHLLFKRLERLRSYKELSSAEGINEMPRDALEAGAVPFGGVLSDWGSWLRFLYVFKGFLSFFFFFFFSKDFPGLEWGDVGLFGEPLKSFEFTVGLV